jgi:hypothetical protein
MPIGCVSVVCADCLGTTALATMRKPARGKHEVKPQLLRKSCIVRRSRRQKSHFVHGKWWQLVARPAVRVSGFRPYQNAIRDPSAIALRQDLLGNAYARS